MEIATDPSPARGDAGGGRADRRLDPPVTESPLPGLPDVLAAQDRVGAAVDEQHLTAQAMHVGGGPGTRSPRRCTQERSSRRRASARPHPSSAASGRRRASARSLAVCTMPGATALRPMPAPAQSSVGAFRRTHRASRALRRRVGQEPRVRRRPDGGLLVPGEASPRRATAGREAGSSPRTTPSRPPAARPSRGAADGGPRGWRRHRSSSRGRTARGSPITPGVGHDASMGLRRWRW